MNKIALVFCLSLFTTFLFSCSDNELSKEDQIKQFIETGVAAAEDRSHSDLTDMIDPSYRDQKGFNKQSVSKLLRAYFFQHKNIFLFTKIRDITLPAEDQALVTLHVAMAGSVISDVSVLSGLRARIYRFELELVKEEDWLLRAASWQRANFEDMQ